MKELGKLQAIFNEEYPEINIKLTPTTKFSEIETLDSLELGKIVLQLEKYYDIRIDDDLLLALKSKTVQDLINEIVLLCKNKK